ncbi:MAG: hypothetical protein KC776_27450 [Myxococcales bacterium]|nr:hypothetical protein [Myxococcales bacterium]MCB9577783.1 hypothetical protein [Polyangiaceae bacterium]
MKKLWLLGAAGLVLASVMSATGASARVEGDSEYSKALTYNGALRYLRVDMGYEVVEKDPDAAYILFRYEPPGHKQPTNGSVEIVETRDDVKVFVQLPQMPSYHETVLRDGLMKKLRTEYGAPPKKKKKPAPKPIADAGSD